MRSSLPDWVPFAVGSALFAGLTAVFGKVGVSGLSSDLATLLRTCVVVAFTGAVVLARGEWRSPLELPGKALAFLVLSALATGASWLCYYRALQLGPASRVAPVDKLSVVFAVVLAALFLREPLDARAMVGTALIVAGSVIMALR